MKEYFARLGSMERRFIVGVALVLFVLLNWIFVRPLFADWAKYQARRQKAAATIQKFEDTIALAEKYKPLVTKLESEGMSVPAEDQTVNFMLTIQSQAAATAVGINSSTRMPEKTNQFFIERVQNVATVSGESELVNFLFSLGSGDSLIRVRGLSIRTDPPRQKLTANVTLVASYQKKVAPKPAAPAPTTKPAAESSKPAAPEKAKPAPAEKSKSPTGTHDAPQAPGVPKPSTPTKK